MAICIKEIRLVLVALRKESVDRNRDNEMALQEGMKVALRKESVDRNNCFL